MIDPGELAAMRALWAAAALAINGEYRALIRAFSGKPEVQARIAADCLSYWLGRDGREVLAMAGHEPDEAAARAMAAVACDLSRTRKGHMGHPNRIDEDAMRRLAAQGLTQDDVASRLGASRAGVGGAARRVGVAFGRVRSRHG